jgi:hypothetical protein
VKRFPVSFLALVLLAGASVISPKLATAETVVVKYRGPVDLSPFACEWVTRSSVVKTPVLRRTRKIRHCESDGHVLPLLRGTARPRGGLASGGFDGAFLQRTGEGPIRLPCSACSSVQKVGGLAQVDEPGEKGWGPTAFRESPCPVATPLRTGLNPLRGTGMTGPVTPGKWP